MLYIMREIVRMKEFFSKMSKREEKGQTLIEYALIIGLVVIAVIVVLGLLGTQIGTLFTTITDTLGNVI